MHRAIRQACVGNGRCHDVRAGWLRLADLGRSSERVPGMAGVPASLSGVLGLGMRVALLCLVSLIPFP